METKFLPFVFLKRFFHPLTTYPFFCFTEVSFSAGTIAFPVSSFNINSYQAYSHFFTYSLYTWTNQIQKNILSPHFSPCVSIFSLSLLSKIITTTQTLFPNRWLSIFFMKNQTQPQLPPLTPPKKKKPKQNKKKEKNEFKKMKEQCSANYMLLLINPQHNPMNEYMSFVSIFLFNKFSK